MKSSQILENAKAYIETNGWKQLGWGKNGVDHVWKSGGACLMLSISRANPNAYDLDEAKLTGFNDYDEGAEWNDHKDRTVEDVYALLDERIAYYKELGD